MKKIILAASLAVGLLFSPIVNIFAASSPEITIVKDSEAEKLIKEDTHLIGDVIDITKGHAKGEHMVGVTIQVLGTNVGVMTDGTGHFFIKNLPEGTYTARATFLGYTSQDIKFTLSLKKVQKLTFTLKEDAIMLDNVVVSASRNDTKKMDAPNVVSIVTSKLMLQTNSVNLGQSLNYQPGVRVENGCQNCGMTSIRMNGLDGPYTQMLIDNRPILSALSGVYILDQIPASMIDHIEVIRGGGSSLFGANAIAGTVNIITKEPLSNSMTVSNTTMLTGNEKLDMNTSVNAAMLSDTKKYGVSVYGNNRTREAWDANSDGFSEIGELSSQNIGFNSFYNLGLHSKLKIEGSTSHEYRRGGDSLSLPAHRANIAEQIETTIYNGGVNYHWFTADYKHDLVTYVSAQKVNRKSYYGTHQDPTAYGWTTSLNTISGVQYNYAMDKLLFMPAKLTAGVEYNTETIADSALTHARDLEQEVNTYSVFAQNAWKNDKVTILLGARLDKNSLLDDAILSPRLNFKYNPIAYLAFRAGYAMGYRAPQVFDEDLHVSTVGGERQVIRNSADLTEEHSHSFSLSADWTKPFSNGSQFHLLVDGFYTTLDDVFYLEDRGEDASGNLIKERVNSSGSKVYGVNLEATYTPTHQLSLQLGGTLQRSLYDEAEAFSDDVEARKEVFRSPNNYGFFNINYTPTHHFTTTLTGTYTGSMWAEHYIFNESTGSTVAKAEETPDFFDVNVKFSYEFHLGGTTELTLNCGMMNILDAYQDDFDIGSNRDAGYVYGPSQPRSVFVGLVYSL